jgi:hypothetical protein
MIGFSFQCHDNSSLNREGTDSVGVPNGNAIGREQVAERFTVCLAADSGRRGTGQDTGWVMITEYDQADKIREYHDELDAKPAANPAPMTADAARRLAAMLAPHLVAMRAITAGTRYAESGGSAADDVFSGPAAPAVSPATRIFIAGMLQRLPT